MDKKILLLADDDIDDKDLFREALESIDSSITCHIADNGKEALSKLDSLQDVPQLIFLDINMPVMNGLQCLAKLQADERYNRIPVIVISTSSYQREMDMVKSLGAVCYFTKPHHFTELTQILQVIVTHLSTNVQPAIADLQERYPRYIHAL
ncbi:MAG: response regulator [Sphingobacteriales bacterium]|nr:MAG: response regulator [Sphingobacteriales bacterium]